MSGISTNRRCDSSATCLAGQGCEFVFRYHSRTTTQPEKRLHPAEAAQMARAGLSIATVYQDRARALEDFGAARGEEDARSAVIYAGQVGQPAGSAVYFAVDADFSAAEINAAIVPYFQSIDKVFRAAGGGTSYLKIGVYGSGLTCRLVGALNFVSFTWLAESTGWRESKSYQGWAVKQTLNTGQTLCNLGNAFERCDAAGHDFGQFKPVGFDVLAGQGEERRVLAEGGNIRLCPSTRFNEPIALLPGAQAVRVLGRAAPGWQRVRTTLGGGEIIGYIADSRLAGASPANVAPASPEPAALVPTPATPAVPIASLAENNPNSNRGSTDGRAYPIGESSRKTRHPAASAADRVRELTEIGDWLASPTSKRYQPTPTATYCNVYAADYCYLASVYLPRVWWTNSALLKIAQGTNVPVLYGDTVRELRADDLFAWLCDMGPMFGWTRVFDASALQKAANEGGVGVICADRKAPGRSGHITVVVPEVAGHAATRDADGHVVQPLQSQAGARNFRYGSAGPSWWLSSDFIDRGFFIHP